MKDPKAQSGSDPEKKPAESFAVQPPAISLPKGGGAIRGMGEKFAANPVTGTGAMTVPIATSPGRSGFGPQLSLSYDSGSGNGPFGFGWSLSIPSITRKTDKGLPRYRDAVESDVYLLSGAEDLVPVLDDGGQRHVDETIDPAYLVHRYRPRVEGLFARIERWTRRDTGEIHWRSFTRDNVMTTYGVDAASRIADAADPTRVFSWLLCRSQDDKGNVIVYEYVAEDDAGIDRRDSNERNRTRGAGRYLKRIRYGNRTSRLARPDWEADGWLFEVVFDYDEDHLRDLPWNPAIPATEQHHRVQVAATARAWGVRSDPFSTYRAGFEVRTHRRCRRVLMFHLFDELTTQTGGAPYLVRATELDYDDLPYDAPVAIDAELAHQGSTRFASFVRSIRQSGYLLEPGSTDVYLRKSLPPVEFEYSKARIDDELRELAAADLENLPIGLDDRAYRWLDLDGEGLSGILTEQADTWFYKPNLGDGRFGSLRVVPTRPNVRLDAGGQQLVDLSGDGQLDVVAFGGPTPGFYERTLRDDWESFRTFEQLPELRWDEPNVRLVDLSGDGHADVLVTENEVFTWYRSRGEQGFDAAERVHQPADEERGPRLVLADGTQSIFLADMSGDGMSDLVRIRNGEVCYWPNLGYGRFGAKVTMDDAPWFDSPDQFDEQRIRLADIDGSGATDILYLHRDGVRIYFNQSGNRWSAVRPLRIVPPVDNLASVTTADLLGNGTACLVWSSPLPADAARPLRYVDLMGGQKPHLLVRTINNLGLTTEITYVPSTKFYLADQRAGTPWITRLPFPVHCVERVTISDRWKGTRFSTTYSYHHGYFDGHEREFRGFGRVEQLDSENYGEFLAGNAASPYITDDLQLYQPPVKTVTWFHTGVMLDRRRIISQYASEYFRHPSFVEHELPEPDLAAEDLTADEWREALRACSGMMLRQETYELDVDALINGVHLPVKLFSAVDHNCHIHRLQARGQNRHAVFLATESEALAYHYELDLRGADPPDPRIVHTLHVRADELGHALQSVSIVYPRIGRHVDTALPPRAEGLIASVQREVHVAYTETRYTNDVDDGPAYRLRAPYEVMTFELTGVTPDTGPYFTLRQLRNLRLSPFHQPDSDGPVVIELPYHRRALEPGPHIRLVELVRTLYFADDAVTPLAFGRLGALGLTFETYKLALTDDLLTAVFDEEQLVTARPLLQDTTISGYLSGGELVSLFPDAAAQYWIRSGVMGFEADASARFYMPKRHVDAFGNTTTTAFDGYHLFLESSRDPAGNVTRVYENGFDYRVLAPTVILDINDNLTEVVYDILGSAVATASRGKSSEGDDLGPYHTDVLLAQPSITTAAELFTTAYREDELHRLLSTATARHFYWFGEFLDPRDGALTFGASPAATGSVSRETHVVDLGAGETASIQVTFEYSDGEGLSLARKQKAEAAPGATQLRWLTTGRVVLNNKGNPVKQYEPYFSSNEHRFEDIAAAGATLVVYYDAVGRVVRTDAPDGSYSRVDVSPWHLSSYDRNDTVLEAGNAWYAARADLPIDDPRRRAAEQAASHAGTATTSFLDSLGREVVTIAHNRFVDRRLVSYDEKYITFTKLDTEGKPLWIRDDRGKLVIQHITPVKPTRLEDEPAAGLAEALPDASVPGYDVAGNLLFQNHMDSGARWMLPDAGGHPLLGWDTNVRVTDEGERVLEHRTRRIEYDVLRRAVARWLTIDGEQWMVERMEYGESLGAPAEAREHNLRGRLHQHHDPAGLVVVRRYDFKGNVVEAERQLTAVVDAAVVDWSPGYSPEQLESEVFHRVEEYDALGRRVRIFDWHRQVSRVPVQEPRYNERGLVSSLDVYVAAARDASNRRVGGRLIRAVVDVRYNERGQVVSTEYGNGTESRRDYDAETFRLTQIRTTRPGYRQPFPDYRSGRADENVLQQIYLAHDAVGNVVEVHDDAFEPVYFRNQVVEAQSRYEYDAVYRLVRATGRESAFNEHAPSGGAVNAATAVTFPVTEETLRPYEQHFSYDSVGNIVEVAHVARGGSWTRVFEYASDSNRLLVTHTRNRSSTTLRYEYDLHGSMLNLGSAPEGSHVRWDHRDMVRSLDLGGGGVIFYNYDWGKQRTRKSLRHRGGRRSWERLYLGDVEIYRTFGADSANTSIETHHVSLGDERVLIIDDVVASDDPELPIGVRCRYQYGNHLGSVGVELDEDRAIVSYEEYHPYGSIAYHARGRDVRAARKRYSYTGMERDEESGLGYHHARNFASWLCRWISADPAGLKDGLNSYGYVRGNPIRYRDRDGECREGEIPPSALSSEGLRRRREAERRERAALLHLRAELRRAEAEAHPMPPPQPMGPPQATIRGITEYEAQFIRPPTAFERGEPDADRWSHNAEVREWERYFTRLREHYRSGRGSPERLTPGREQVGGLAIAEAALERPYESVIYLRLNRLTGSYYIGRASARDLASPTMATELGFAARSGEHGARNQQPYEFWILERVPRSLERFAEETWIRRAGGPSRYGGLLENYRYEMNDELYRRTAEALGRRIPERPTMNTTNPRPRTPRPSPPTQRELRAARVRADRIRRARQERRRR